MWTPLASVSFPNNAIGLKTYHKLREFRKLHETSYDERIKMETSMKVRKYIIMNQRANSIADLAESLRIEIERAQDQDVVIEEGDVIVRWRNVLDAEYAGQWPELVQHAEMGRGSLEGKDDRVHVAPKAEIVNKPVPQAPEVEKKVRAKKPKVAV